MTKFPQIVMPSDYVTPKYNFGRQVKTLLSEKESWNENQPSRACFIYTDGSRQRKERD